MPKDMPKTDANDGVKKLAERMVQYETHDKSAMGKLFAFEARDGFFSKLDKTLTTLAYAVGSSTAAFIAVAGLASGLGTAGLAIAGVSATAAGLVSGGIGRATNKRIYSDLHDSHKGNLGKFGHWVALGLPAKALGGIQSFATSALGPIASAATALITGNTIYPLVNVVSSSAIASSGFGDQQLRQESAAAKELAERAITSGQSVEQVLEKEKPTKHAANNEKSMDHGHDEPEQEKSNHFTKMVEEQRANAKATQRE